MVHWSDQGWPEEKPDRRLLRLIVVVELDKDVPRAAAGSTADTLGILRLIAPGPSRYPVRPPIQFRPAAILHRGAED
jgi:hypothetical protein